MNDQRDKDGRRDKAGRQHQTDWASQRQHSAQQQRQRGGSGRQDIDDSDQALGAGMPDDSAMLDEGGARRGRERDPDR